jgi:hypothetical protein
MSFHTSDGHPRASHHGHLDFLHKLSLDEICGRQSGIETGFSPNPSVFLCQYHSTATPCSLIYYPGVEEKARYRSTSTETSSHSIATATIPSNPITGARVAQNLQRQCVALVPTVQAGYRRSQMRDKQGGGSGMKKFSVRVCT